MKMKYQVGGNITIDGVEYEIDSVDISAMREGDTLVLSYNVRTRPNSEMVELTITNRSPVQAG